MPTPTTSSPSPSQPTAAEIAFSAEPVTPEAKQNVSDLFELLVRQKQAAGLSQKQARVIAASQIYNDVDLGLIDRNKGIAFLIEYEQQFNGLTVEHATLVVNDKLPDLSV
jgi:hypothetical protein